MRVNFNPQLNFKGNFWLVSDSHSRLSRSAGVLSQIEKDSFEKTTIIDGGDCFHDSFPNSCVGGVYCAFKKNNPDADVVFNLGNIELEFLLDVNNGERKMELLNWLSKMKESGVKIISSQAPILEESFDVEKGLVEPYAIVEDDGKKVLIVGTSVSSDRITFKVEQQKKMLRKTFEKIKANNEQYDSVILVSHNSLADINSKAEPIYPMKEIISYVKYALGVNNLKLVAGGHPHSIDKLEIEDVPVVYTPPNGKGALRAKHRNGEFSLPEIEMKSNGFDYSPYDSKEDGVIGNLDLNNLLKINPDYEKIIDTYPEAKRQIGELKFDVPYKNIDAPLSENYPLGTFVANSIRDVTKSDFGFLMSVHLREPLPPKGSMVNANNILETMNVDKPIYKIENVSVMQLKKIFEASFKRQNEGHTNPNFLEFSNNLKVVRHKTEQEDGSRVVQICVDNVPLLDENGNVKEEFENKKFSLSTCDFVAKGIRAGMDVFRYELSDKKPYIEEDGSTFTTKKALEYAVENMGNEPFENSELITIE